MPTHAAPPAPQRLELPNVHVTDALMGPLTRLPQGLEHLEVR